MNLSFNVERRSATVKVAAIGILILVLLIPVGMIKAVISDRTHVRSTAQMDIQNSWGGPQLIAGPVLRLPFKAEAINSYGTPYLQDRFAFLVADELTIAADTSVETRYRGIHEVPVYAADISFLVSFDLQMLAELGLDGDSIAWQDAELLLGISDTASINRVPGLVAEGTERNFSMMKQQLAGLPTQLSVRIGGLIDDWRNSTNLQSRISLSVNGTESLRFLTLAESSEIRVSADWPSPSFVGRRLPVERQISETAFSALWQTTSLGRKLPATWINGEAVPDTGSDGVFGVRFMQPIGLYQLVDRALKYAIMIVGLTFVTYFLMETIGGVRLHPLQYLLVGLANTLFYLLLLSLAEHIGFGPAYIASALSAAALIVGYSANVLQGRHRASIMSAVLGGLYAFLYLTLKAESYALLAGSIGLWVVLAAVMYLTRKVNWYATQASASDAQRPMSGSD